MKSRFPLVLAALVVLAILFVIGRNAVTAPTPAERSAAAAAAAARNANGPGTPAGETAAGRIIRMDETQPAPLPPRPAGAQAAEADTDDPKTRMAKLWKKTMAAARVDSGAPELLASIDPNDWLRASSLHLLCLNGLGADELDPARAAAVDAKVGAVYRKVATAFAARCGDLGQNAYAARYTHLESRALEAGAALSLAPALTDTTLEKGLTGAELRQLQLALADGEVASLWLARNFRRLDAALATVPGLAATPREDLQVAAVVAFCMRGLDCGADSLMTLQLCVNTRGVTCSEAGVAAVMQQMPPDRAARINSAARSIDGALSGADPMALGIRERKKP